ncbi:hypothetical protein LY76DRAFT_280395 [Colletotrichum caudatum]|nr:hypothetical protein LY76DRAFT_280395 [Colletotrichum caudatum]
MRRKETQQNTERKGWNQHTVPSSLGRYACRVDRDHASPRSTSSKWQVYVVPSTSLTVARRLCLATNLVRPPASPLGRHNCSHVTTARRRGRRTDGRAAKQARPVGQPGSIQHLSPPHHQRRRHRGKDAARNNNRGHRIKTSSKEAVSNHDAGGDKMALHPSMEPPPTFFAPQISTLTDYTTYRLDFSGWTCRVIAFASLFRLVVFQFEDRQAGRQPETDESRGIHPVRLLSSRISLPRHFPTLDHPD